MKFYVKNPNIRHSVTVQGVQMNSDTVVCGEEYALFANRNTFPGKEPKLVEVDFASMTSDQQKAARSFAAKTGQKAPRHLGPTTSASINVKDTVSQKLQSLPDIEKNTETKKKQRCDEKPSVLSEGLPALRDLYQPEQMVDQFPGITNENAPRVLEAFDTFDDLIRAKKSEMRLAGISPTYSTRLRRAARRAKEAHEQKNDFVAP